jgi:hypothetical protein
MRDIDYEQRGRFWDCAEHLLSQIEVFFLIDYVKMLRAMKTIQRRRMIAARLKVDPEYAPPDQREPEMTGRALSHD